MPGLVPLQHGGDPARRSRGAHAVHEGVDSSPGLAPDLFAQRVIARDAVLVVELVGPVGAGLAAQLTGGLDHVQDQFPGGAAPLARHQRQLRTQRRHVIPLLLAEGIRGDDPDTVALGGADQRQRRARAAARVLDDRVTGPQPAVLLGPRNHRLRHAVLEAAGGVLPLQLHEDVRALGRHDVAQANHRGVADGAEDFHGRALPSLTDRSAQSTMNSLAPTSVEER